MSKKKKKSTSRRTFYCYVDESGQDPRSNWFIVGAVVFEGDRDAVEDALTEIGLQSGKRNQKWGRTPAKYREAYISRILKYQPLHGCMLYAMYSPREKYFPLIIRGAYEAINLHVPAENYTTLVYVDGLGNSLIQPFKKELRKRGIEVGSVRPVRKDENNVLMLLADAVCGFTRAGLEGKRPFQEMLSHAEREGIIRKV